MPPESNFSDETTSADIDTIFRQTCLTHSVELGQALAKAHLTRAALAEAIAILGLVLFLLNGSLLHLFAFIAIAFVLLGLIFPRQAEWAEAQSLIRYFEEQEQF